MLIDRPATAISFVSDPAENGVNIVATFRSRTSKGTIHETRHAGGRTTCTCPGYVVHQRCWHVAALAALTVDDLVLELEMSVSSGSICDHRDRPDDVAHPAHAG